MKTLRTFFRGLSLLVGVAALVMFFFTFVTVKTYGGIPVDIAGAELAFGSTLKIDGVEYHLAKSMYYMFAMIIIALGALFSGLSFKFKGTAYAAPAFNLVGVITFLVFICTPHAQFVDTRLKEDVFDKATNTWDSKLLNFSTIDFQMFFWVAFILVCLALVVSIISLFVADRVAVLESNGEKKSILSRVVEFFREYKGEIKKIVWPGPRSVVKNTLIVLLMCVLIGVFIWIADILFAMGFLKLFTK